MEMVTVSKIGDGKSNRYRKGERGDTKVMEKKRYISEEEQTKCRAVANAFAELEEENIIVVDAGRFGFLKLLYYKYPDGIDDVIFYSDSKKLFDDLWQDWLYEQLQKIAKDDPSMRELDYEDMLEVLSPKRQKELQERKKDFARKAGIDLFLM